MVERMRVSWRLARATLQVLRLNTDLLIFPIVGLIAFGVIIALLAGTILVLADFRIGVLMQAPIWAQLAATFVLYLVGYFVVFSANTAMVGTAMLLMDGERVTLADGWRIAYTHKNTIFAYALLMATIGIILRLFSRWVGQVGRFVVPVMQRIAIFAVLDLAWHVVPVLIIPVLLVEHRNPLDAIQRSSRLVTQRWGEGVVQTANVWLIFFLPMVATIAAGVYAIIWAGQSMQEVWITTILYVIVMLIVMMFLMASGLNDIFSAVIYRYASAMPIPTSFEQELLSKTFQARPSRILRSLRRWWGYLVRQPQVNHIDDGVPTQEVTTATQGAEGVVQVFEAQEESANMDPEQIGRGLSDPQGSQE